MNKTIKILLMAAIFVLSLLLFNILEFDLLNQGSKKYLQSLIFSFTLTLSVFYPKSRRKLLYGGFFMVFSMAAFFLLDKISLANFLGSIGVGMILLILLSVFPEIVKKGEVKDL